jgi:hypothetical protein
MDLPIDSEAGTRPWRLPDVARWRPTMRALLVAAAVVLACGFVIAVMTAGPSQWFRPTGFGFDTRSYWGLRVPLYPGPGTDDGYGFYRYSPAFVPFLMLASAVPWPVFAIGWIALLVGIYIWMAGDAKWPLLVFVPVLFEFYLGNIHLLLALAVVLGFRWPASWAFVLLTKITPGIGLWWFVVRREWRSLSIALGATAAIVLLGLIVAPGAWRDWYVSLTVTAPAIGSNQVPIPLPIRLLAAFLLVTWGALTDRRWTVMVAATLALPTLWFHGLAMLVGIVALEHGQPERLAASIERVGQRMGAASRALRQDRVEA